MDFLKFLKKKQPLSFEMLLQKAADEPFYRTEFIKRVLSEKFVIITKDDRKSDGYITLQPGSKVNIFTFRDGRIPFFTSTERIFDNGVIKEEVHFVELTGDDLFNLVQGAALFLNPYSDYGKEFSAEEIQRLLNGTYFSSNAKRIKIKKTTEVKIGQPSRYPTKAIKTLNRLFSDRQEVLAAYLGWILDPTTNDPPHYIFALKVEAGYDDISQEVGFVVNEILGGEIFDVIQITGKGGLEDYFINETKPFYVKTI